MNTHTDVKPRIRGWQAFKSVYGSYIKKVGGQSKCDLRQTKSSTVALSLAKKTQIRAKKANGREKSNKKRAKKCELMEGVRKTDFRPVKTRPPKGK
jgi:hypothetical protein